MPTYDYRCTNCGHCLEAFQKITASPLKDCPKCSQPTLTRGPGGGVGLSFVGSGWYKSGYVSTPEAKTIESAPKENEPKPKEKKCCPCGDSKGTCSK